MAGHLLCSVGRTVEPRLDGENILMLLLNGDPMLLFKWDRNAAGESPSPSDAGKAATSVAWTAQRPSRSRSASGDFQRYSTV